MSLKGSPKQRYEWLHTAGTSPTMYTPAQRGQKQDKISHSSQSWPHQCSVAPNKLITNTLASAARRKQYSQDPGRFRLTLLPGKVTGFFLFRRLQPGKVSRHLLPRDLLAHSSDDILILLPAAFRQSSPVPAPTNLHSDGMDQGLPPNPGLRWVSGSSGGVRAARGRRQLHCGRPQTGDEL